MSRTRIFIAMAASCCIAATAGCGSDDSAKPGGKSTLSFLIPEGPGRVEAFGKVIRGYERIQPDVDVELRTVPFKDFYAQVPVQFASDNPPDLVLADSPDVKSYAYNRSIEPVDDLFSARDRADFARSIVQELTYEGKLYGAPWEESAIAVYYNADMFARAGVKPPVGVDDAWTWPRFVEATRRVVASEARRGNAGVWGSVFLNNPPVLDYWNLPLVRSNGAVGSPTYRAIAPEGDAVSGFADTAEAKAAYRYWRELYASRFLPTSDVPDAFGTGKAATMFAFPAWGGVLDDAFGKLDWGVTPLPYLRTPVTHTGGYSVVVAAKGDNVPAAKAFARFVSSPDGFRTYYESSHVMPARKSLLSSLEEFQRGPLSIFRDELVRWGVPRPAGPGHGIYADQIGKLLADVAKGAEVEDAVKAFVAQTDQLLRKYRR